MVIAPIERLQKVDARQQCALSRSARPDDGDDLAAVNCQIDAL
jgi:hypothetical protein